MSTTNIVNNTDFNDLKNNIDQEQSGEVSNNKIMGIIDFENNIDQEQLGEVSNNKIMGIINLENNTDIGREQLNEKSDNKIVSVISDLKYCLSNILSENNEHFIDVDKNNHIVDCLMGKNDKNQEMKQTNNNIDFDKKFMHFKTLFEKDLKIKQEKLNLKKIELEIKKKELELQKNQNNLKQKSMLLKQNKMKNKITDCDNEVNDSINKISKSNDEKIDKNNDEKICKTTINRILLPDTFYEYFMSNEIEYLKKNIPNKSLKLYQKIGKRNWDLLNHYIIEREELMDQSDIEKIKSRDIFDQFMQFQMMNLSKKFPNMDKNERMKISFKIWDSYNIDNSKQQISLENKTCNGSTVSFKSQQNKLESFNNDGESNDEEKYADNKRNNINSSESDNDSSSSESDNDSSSSESDNDSSSSESNSNEKIKKKKIMEKIKDKEESTKKNHSIKKKSYKKDNTSDDESTEETPIKNKSQKYKKKGILESIHLPFCKCKYCEKYRKKYYEDSDTDEKTD